MSLLQTTERTPSRLFSFMNPLAVEIWLSLLGAYVMVSLIVSRFSPWMDDAVILSKLQLSFADTRWVVRNNPDFVIRSLNEFSNNWYNKKI